MFDDMDDDPIQLLHLISCVNSLKNLENLISSKTLFHITQQNHRFVICFKFSHPYALDH